jgi:hypothetical protein
MNGDIDHGPGGDLPKLAAPARRALASAGITRLEQLATLTESELRDLHGMGPSALTVLRVALERRGLTLRTPTT